MESVKDYLDRLEINNNILNKQLKEVYVSKVIYFREDKIVYFHLTSKSIISYEILESLKIEIKSKLSYFKDIKIKISYTGLDRKENKDIIKMYWMNIVYILKTLCPSISGWYKQIEYLCIEDNLKIKLPKGLFYDRLMKLNIVYILKSVLIEELGIDLNINIEKAVDEVVDVKRIIRKTERIVEDKIKELEISSKQEKTIDKEAAYIIKPEYDDKMIYGENINAMVEKICDLNNSSGTVSIVGEIFDIDTKELKNGKILMIAAITDYTSSISCKLFLNDINKDSVLGKLSKGAYVKIKGDIMYDTYQRELTMTISGIREEDKPQRTDKSEEKRVELHAHTQMSSMDAVTSTKKLIQQAAKWGHKAIAITDHGVVQAFPEAMGAAKGNDIKILYGVEGYLVEDSEDIVQDANDKELSQTFVVFDIETTGFSNTNDKITEIGAVKIENFKIVDKFSELINPQKDISYKIQELTGITNDMVKDKPTIEEVLPKFIEFIGDSVLVAHNAEFDMSFISEKCRQQNIEFKNKSVDTLTLARILLPELKRHRLNVVAKALGVPLLNHHRAVDDAQATALIFIKFLEMLEKKGAKTLQQVNEVLGKIDYTKLGTSHITLIAKNYVGLKNLYKIVSDAHVNHFYRSPRILRSVLEAHKEGIIIGSA